MKMPVPGLMVKRVDNSNPFYCGGCKKLHEGEAYLILLDDEDTNMESKYCRECFEDYVNRLVEQIRHDTRRFLEGENINPVPEDW
jgi:hypothetical protein